LRRLNLRQRRGGGGHPYYLAQQGREKNRRKEKERGRTPAGHSACRKKGGKLHDNEIGGEGELNVQRKREKGGLQQRYDGAGGGGGRRFYRCPNSKGKEALTSRPVSERKDHCALASAFRGTVSGEKKTSGSTPDRKEKRSVMASHRIREPQLEKEKGRLAAIASALLADDRTLSPHRDVPKRTYAKEKRGLRSRSPSSATQKGQDVGSCQRLFSGEGGTS